MRVLPLLLLLPLASPAGSAETAIRPERTIRLFDGKSLAPFYTWLVDDHRPAHPEGEGPVEAVAEGTAPRAIIEQIKTFERELEQLDKEIAGLEARARLGQLDVARALRGLEPALDA